MSSYRSLIDIYNKTKQELGDAENTIRRITGRDPDEVSNSTSRSSSKFRQASSRATYSGRNKPSYSATKRSREESSSYEEESEEEEEEEEDDDESPKKKPALQSTVVAKRHQKRTRKATIEEQNANSKIKARNRRMFGALIGVLEKFQDEEKKRQHKESMRAEIEQKVEAATEEEREKIKKEKEQLFLTRKEKQVQLRCLEKKIERAQSHEVCATNHRHMMNFIMTKSEPPVFFLPMSHNGKSRKRLDETRAKLKEHMKKMKENYELDVHDIEEWYKVDSIPSNKENKSPKDEGMSQDIPETDVSMTLKSEKEDIVHHDDNAGGEDSESNSDDDNDDNNKPDDIKVPSIADQDFEPIYD